MHRYQIIFAMLLLLAINPAPAGEQRCSGPLHRPVSDFVEIGDGSQLLDKKSKLIWMRCIEDQTWAEGVCHANEPDAVNPGPRVTYSQALALAAQHSASSQKWRLPTYRELDALREPNCYNPSANLSLFPTKPAWSSDGAFWTQSPAPEADRRKLVSAIGQSDSWSKTDDSQTNHVRLVREASKEESKLAK
jgi:hypothetical protein